MQIQVDTREHNKEWERIKGQFDALGVQYFRSKMYVGDYQSLDNPRLVIDAKGVTFWQNPRKYQIRWKTVNGKRVKDVISAKAVDGNQLYKSLCTIRDRYGVSFIFCTKEETGQKIIEILGGSYD